MALLDHPFALALVGIAALLGCVMLWYGGRELVLAYRIVTNDPTDVMSLGDGGPVEVEGTAQPQHGTLTSLFTETPCLAYEYEVEEERNSKNGRHWETVDSGRNHTPFRVEDGTASALVDPRAADFRFSDERSIDVRGGKRPPERVQEFIRQNEDVGSEEKSLDLKLFELNTGKDRKYIERRLDPDESVHILGEARYDASAGKEGGEVNVVIGYGDDTHFLISDTDERGAAWRVAANGLPYVVAGVLFFGIGAFVLGV
ncbi:E3 ubiquitin ligase family protein [Haladaptatus sp. DYF46]|uniref:E3 ubiquitin ligase family protein n=1 Tax=Haladaptatus sp. DYF46 TaxID=2886041 RepID=UPI001E36B773|nr:E3 ubiquitin ligase family protein [Haladaptatus sp. DYF46]